MPILKRDAQGNVIQESYLGDMKFRGEYVAGQLITQGRARSGSNESDDVWQLGRMTYIGNDLTQVNWAEGSSQFAFSWADRATYTYS